tara:strand:+ start:582 stop:728 length:147 start_codon:yes stop_codon:yes gene_type:complete
MNLNVQEWGFKIPFNPGYDSFYGYCCKSASNLTIIPIKCIIRRENERR